MAKHIQSLTNKTDAVEKLILERSIDVLTLTETVRRAIRPAMMFAYASPHLDILSSTLRIDLVVVEVSPSYSGRI